MTSSGLSPTSLSPPTLSTRPSGASSSASAAGGAATPLDATMPLPPARPASVAAAAVPSTWRRPMAGGAAGSAQAAASAARPAAAVTGRRAVARLSTCRSLLAWPQLRSLGAAAIASTMAEREGSSYEPTTRPTSGACGAVILRPWNAGNASRGGDRDSEARQLLRLLQQDSRCGGTAGCASCANPLDCKSCIEKRVHW